MNRLERYENLTEAMIAALQGWQSEVWTGMPAIIESFNPLTQTCTCQPTIKALVKNQDGTLTWEQLPLLVDVPVEFPSGGGFTLTFPVAKGNECFVKFASRNIDAWWGLGGIQNQPELRMHDLSDGVALVGIRSQANLLSGGVSSTTAQLRLDTGSDFIELGPDGSINLTSWAGMLAPFARGSVPAGWIACPPSSSPTLSTSTYARLFATIGYAWGGSGGLFSPPYCPIGYTFVQGTIAALTHGQVLDHIHNTAYAVYNNSANASLGAASGGSTQTVIATTNPTNGPHGSDNLAAGLGVQWCVKY